MYLIKWLVIVSRQQLYTQTYRTTCPLVLMVIERVLVNITVETAAKGRHAEMNGSEFHFTLCSCFLLHRCKLTHLLVYIHLNIMWCPPPSPDKSKMQRHNLPPKMMCSCVSSKKVALTRSHGFVVVKADSSAIKSVSMCVCVDGGRAEIHKSSCCFSLLCRVNYFMKGHGLTFILKN